MRLKNIQTGDVKNVIRELKDTAIYHYVIVKEIKFKVVSYMTINIYNS